MPTLQPVNLEDFFQMRVTKRPKITKWCGTTVSTVLIGNKKGGSPQKNFLPQWSHPEVLLVPVSTTIQCGMLVLDFL